MRIAAIAAKTRWVSQWRWGSTNHALLDSGRTTIVRGVRWALALTLLMLFAGWAEAAWGAAESAESGYVYASLSADDYVCRGTLAPLQTLSVFVVFDMASAVPDSMSGWELSVTFDLVESVIILERLFLGGDHEETGSGDDNWIVSLAEPKEFTEAAFAVLEYRITSLSEDKNVIIDIAPSDPSSAPWFPAPVWLTAEPQPQSITFSIGSSEQDRPGYPWSYVILNMDEDFPYSAQCPGPVGTHGTSFGALKSQFR